jgi:nucleoside-diphosphate-sugar epimerase
MADSQQAPKHILVTGGSGKAGQWVVRHLRERGFDVVNADRSPSPEVHTYQVDLTDLGQVFAVVEGRDGIVHLAAIPWPGEHAPEVVFRNNVLSTFNVLQAATVLGVRKVVLAGSESALGFPFMFRRFGPAYLPIDEDHPLLAQDAYGLSKIVGEELAQGFVRRTPEMSVISLRFSWILRPEDYRTAVADAQRDVANNEFNLWAYVDVRDVSAACELALRYPSSGFEAVYIAARDTLRLEPTADLVRARFPAAPEVRPGFTGTASPLSCAKAERILGWRPQWSWRDVLEAH